MAEMLLNNGEKKEAKMVTDFLKEINPNRKNEFMAFMLGAKFTSTLSKSEKERSA